MHINLETGWETGQFEGITVTCTGIVYARWIAQSLEVRENYTLLNV